MRSLLAFWMGGASSPTEAEPLPATLVCGSISIYAAVGGEPSAEHAVGGAADIGTVTGGTPGFRRC